MYRISSLQKLISQYRQWQEQVHELKTVADRGRAASKRAVSLLRRDHQSSARQAFVEAESAFRTAHGMVKKYPLLSEMGFFKEAVEEYVEARVYESYLAGKKLVLPSFVSAGLEEMIGGICDTTGELVRRATSIASLENLSLIEAYRDFVQGVSDQLSQVSLGGKLRNKYDDVERNLKRLEQILYDLKLKAQK